MVVARTSTARSGCIRDDTTSLCLHRDGGHMVGDGVVEVARQGNALFVADLGVARDRARLRDTGRPPRGDDAEQEGAPANGVRPSRGRHIHAECRDDRDVCRPAAISPPEPPARQGVEQGPGRPSGPEVEAPGYIVSSRTEQTSPGPSRRVSPGRVLSPPEQGRREGQADHGEQRSRQTSPGRKATSARTATAYTHKGRSGAPAGGTTAGAARARGVAGWWARAEPRARRTAADRPKERDRRRAIGQADPGHATGRAAPMSASVAAYIHLTRRPR